MFDLVKIENNDISNVSVSNLIEDLKYNKIGALIIKNFWSDIDCEKSVDMLSKIGFD